MVTVVVSLLLDGGEALMVVAFCADATDWAFVVALEELEVAVGGGGGGMIC